jgi:2-polyprenyl-6-methoxyphenol hydroxylase-like FAD-dependent oxidoreductase
MMRDPDIVIVGGGIAGLALALGLHQRGILSRVYEVAPEVREIGVGITMLPHAVRELTTLGLGDAVRAAGVENYSSAFFNRFGQLLYSEPRGAGVAAVEHDGRIVLRFGVGRGAGALRQARDLQH